MRLFSLRCEYAGRPAQTARLAQLVGRGQCPAWAVAATAGYGDELRSIALALEADPSKVLQLGLEANRTSLKTADLSRYKVIVF